MIGHQVPIPLKKETFFGYLAIEKNYILLYIFFSVANSIPLPYSKRFSLGNVDIYKHNLLSYIYLQEAAKKNDNILACFVIFLFFFE